MNTSIGFNLNYQCYLVSGSDAESFIHSQVTNDYKSLKENEAQVNCLLNIKSEIVSFFIIIKKEELEILVPKENCLEFEERFNQFLIMEDVEIKKCDKEYFLNLNTSYGYKLKYFDTEFKISSQQPKEFLDEDILSGQYLFPIWNKNVLKGDLLTDSFLVESATSFKKGCYLGQETVSKIYNNRGSAKFPAYVESDGPINSLVTFKFDNKYFNLLKLSRENRVEGKKIQEGIVHLIPYIGFTDKAKAKKLYDNAIDLFNSNKDIEAVELLKQTISLDPSLADAYEVLGVILGRDERYDEAISHMNKLLELDEKSIMAHTNLSLFYMKKGLIDEAEKHKALATVNSFEMMGEKAEIEKNKEAEIKRRESMFKEVLEIDPDDVLASYGMGDIYLERGMYKNAIERFVHVLNNDEKYSVAYVGLAKSLMAINDSPAAKEVLEKGIDIASKQGDMMPANEMQSMLNRV